MMNRKTEITEISQTNRIDFFSMDEINVTNEISASMKNCEEAKHKSSIKKYNVLYNYDFYRPSKIIKGEIIHLSVIIHNALMETKRKLESGYDLSCKVDSSHYDGEYCRINDYFDTFPEHYVTGEIFVLEFIWFGYSCFLQIDSDLLYKGFLDKENKTFDESTKIEKKVFKQLIEELFIKELYNSFANEFKNSQYLHSFEDKPEICIPQIIIKDFSDYSYLDVIGDYNKTGMIYICDFEINKAEGSVRFFINADAIVELRNLGFPMECGGDNIRHDKIIPLNPIPENLEMILGRCNLTDNNKLEKGTILEINSDISLIPIEYNHVQIAKSEAVICEEFHDETYAARIIEMTESLSKKDHYYKNNFNTRIVMAGKNIFDEEELSDLKEGSIIKMNQLLNSPVKIIKDEKVIALGEPIVLNAQFMCHIGVKISKVFQY